MSKSILQALNECDHPVMLVAGSKTQLNVFKGNHLGKAFHFAMNVEEAFDPFKAGQKLTIVTSGEVAEDSLPVLENMVLSDGTKLGVNEEMSVLMANEKMISPITGETVTIAFDDSDMEDEGEPVEDESTENENQLSEGMNDDLSVEGESIDENNSESMDENNSESMEDDGEPVEGEEIEEESEDNSEDESIEIEDESIEEDDGEPVEGEDDSYMEDDGEPVEGEDEEIPVDMEIEAASFASGKNLRFVAFDSLATEIAMFSGDIHTATFIKKDAKESNRELFTKPSFAKIISGLAEESNFNLETEDLKAFGIKPVKFTINVPSLTTKLVKEIAQEVALSKAEEASDMAEKTQQTLKLALVSMSKGVTNSPIIGEIASVFETLGVKNAKTLIAKAFHNNAESFAKKVYEEASILNTKSSDYLEGFAEMCAKANYLSSDSYSEVASVIPPTNFHIPSVPSKDSGNPAVTPKPRRLLFAGTYL